VRSLFRDTVRQELAASLVATATAAATAAACHLPYRRRNPGLPIRRFFLFIRS